MRITRPDTALELGKKIRDKEISAVGSRHQDCLAQIESSRRARFMPM